MIVLEELDELIKTRRSVRKFQDKPVPEDLLLKALELATWAPNGGNYQPWKFLIITRKELIHKMADAVKAVQNPRKHFDSHVEQMPNPRFLDDLDRNGRVADVQRLQGVGLQESQRPAADLKVVSAGGSGE